MNRLLPAAIILCLAAGCPRSGGAVPVNAAVDEPAVCLECHGDIQEAFGRSHVHTAFADGKCSSCHNPHASRHAALLRTDTGKLCQGCHEEMRGLGSEPVVHQPAAVGKCTSCHDPHAADNRANTVAPMPRLCSGCHQEVDRWLARAVVHDPLQGGQCLACHLPHAGQAAGLLTEAVPGLCMSCHEEDAAFGKAHGGRSLAGTDCTACHDPHASAVPGLLRQNQHRPFASGNCASCHKGLDKDGSFDLGQRVVDLCLRCHRSVEPGLEAMYPHLMNTEESCASCHNPHASNEPSLLLRPQVKLCMGCHFNGKREGDKDRDKSEYITHDGMDCVNCHLPHGADNSALLVRTDSGLCAGCHEQAHKATHPVGPEVIDPRTGKPVTCMSCHQLHGSDFPFYLPLNPDMELCLQCHKK